VDLAISMFSSAQNTTRKGILKNTMKLPAILKWIGLFYCLAFLNTSWIIDLVVFLEQHINSHHFSQKPSDLMTTSAPAVKLLARGQYRASETPVQWSWQVTSEAIRPSFAVGTWQNKYVTLAFLTVELFVI